MSTAAVLPEAVGLGQMLSSYTFRTMLLGTVAVGAAFGALGSFLYLHK